MNSKLNYKSFLILLVLSTVVAVFVLFKPFLTQIVIATVLVSVFYQPYLKIKKALAGKRYLASLVVCLLLILLVVLPVINIVVYVGNKTPMALSKASEIISSNGFLERFNSPILEDLNLKDSLLSATKSMGDFLISGATYIIKGASNLIVSLIILLVTMFFFFADGKSMLRKIKSWSPLPSEYNDEIINKFKSISKATLISIFVTALAQGFVGALGFLVIGWPFIFVFIIMAFLSIIPYLGSSIFYIPVSIYLFLSGNIWQGIFIIAWCWLIVSNVDEIIRAYIIKGKSELNPILIIFSIIGGIAMFGFWGLVIGPLIIAITGTILGIYEKEFRN